VKAISVTILWPPTPRTTYSMLYFLTMLPIQQLFPNILMAADPISKLVCAYAYFIIIKVLE